MVFSNYPVSEKDGRFSVCSTNRLRPSKAVGEDRERGRIVSSENEAGDQAPMDSEVYHESVMANEVLDALSVSEGDVVFDGTLGGGGHSEHLLEAGASVVACDRDLEALAFARARLDGYGDRFRAYHGNYDQMDQLLDEAGESSGVDAIILDLGISSRHVDDGQRGFSFAKNGPLDMRMDSTATLTAEQLVNEGDEAELRRIFWEYGEERASRAVVKAIVRERSVKRIETTEQFAELIETVIPRRGRRHPATKVFQALRIAVNNELGHLQVALEKTVSCLKPGGRLAVISFHSLEDRIVKRFLRQRSQATLDRPEWPEPKPNPEYFFSLPMKKPRIPGAYELKANPRARSAKLRVAIRLGEKIQSKSI